MKKRILTSIAIVSFLVLLFFTKNLTTYLFDAFLVYVAILGGLEMSNLLSKIGYYNNKIAVIVYPILSYGLFKLSTIRELSLPFIFILQIALLIVVAGSITMFCLITKKRSDNEIKTRKLNCSVNQFALYKGVQTLFAILYPAFIISFLYVINNIESMNYIFKKVGTNGYNVSLFFLVFTFVVPMLVDTFAMFTGMTFKGKKLCPKLSPKKTISGAIGGLVWGMIGAVSIFFIFNSIDKYRLIFESIDLTWWAVLIAGLFSSFLCQAGDIFESFIKRKADVKDSGDLLPGHGGILDRIDSHLANMVVVFIFALIILL